MNLLLDTHTLLWWLDDHSILSDRAGSVIADGKNLVFVSAVSIWEIRIKQSLGKLDVPENFRTVLNREQFEPLDITADHAHAVFDLPNYHRNPFDRMLIAQSKVEKLTIVTRDDRFRLYHVPTIPA